MKVNITELLIVFDEILMPPTDEEQKIYWFRKKRSDGLIVTFLFSVYDEYVSVLVSNNTNTTIVDIDMKNCSEIRVLDEKRKCLEIVHDDSSMRCFLSLDDDHILSYDE